MEQEVRGKRRRLFCCLPIIPLKVVYILEWNRKLEEKEDVYFVVYPSYPSK
jgi:hypothetical protein